MSFPFPLTGCCKPSNQRGVDISLLGVGCLDFRTPYDKTVKGLTFTALIDNARVINTSSSLVTYGPSTMQEMCYNFVYAYPANLLSNPGGSLQGADNTCLH
ncbi:MAG TPA: hypothetical protein VF331_05115 [Polyangiales bacterium]